MLTITLQKRVITTLSWDSRSLQPGDWYIPNIGVNFDGHDFINEVFEKGAIGSFCQADRLEKVDVKWREKVLVYETIDHALTALVSEQVMAIRTQYPSVKIITITGTSGKTTTREMLVHTLSTFGKVLVSHANYNTFWGNAFILSQYDGHEYIVLETGLGKENEVRVQNEAIRPDVGLLLNIGSAHGGLAGGESGVFTGKKAMVDVQLAGDRPVVVNGDDEKIKQIIAMVPDTSKLSVVGQAPENFVSFSQVRVTPQGTEFLLRHKNESQVVHIVAIGKNFVYNAMLTVAGTMLVGKSFSAACTALNGYKGFPGRFEVFHLSDRVTIVNDAYNANPTSFENGLQTLAEVWPKETYEQLLVLGDMAELGDDTERLHGEVGSLLKDLGFDQVYYIGQYGLLMHATKVFTSLNEIVAGVTQKIAQNTSGKPLVIYLKGSNSKNLHTVPALLGLATQSGASH